MHSYDAIWPAIKPVFNYFTWYLWQTVTQQKQTLTIKSIISIYITLYVISQLKEGQ